MLVTDSEYPKFWLRGENVNASLLYIVPTAGHAPAYLSPWNDHRWLQSQDFTGEEALNLNAYSGLSVRPITVAQAHIWQATQDVPAHRRDRFAVTHVQEDFKCW